MSRGVGAANLLPPGPLCNEAADLTDVLGAAIAGALTKKGYWQLTAVQQAVCDQRAVYTPGNIWWNRLPRRQAIRHNSIHNLD